MQGDPETKPKAIYTIDFIGSASQPLRYGEPEKPTPAPPPPAPAESEIKTPQKQEPAPAPAPKEESKKEAPKKTAKKEYNSKEQIAKEPKKNTKKTETKKEEPKKAAPEKKVTLSKPSILEEVQSTNIDPSALHRLGTTQGSGDSGPKAIQASFTNFPYPWYITQVRNSLWTQWQKRMPKKSIGLSALVSFNIDKYGAVYSVQIEKSSGNDSYDYAATSAVEKSAPYPPLPKDFPKNLLTVTVEFKNEE